MFRVLETANHYFNYGDALLQNIIFTDWAKDKFNVWLLSLWALIIRIHVISAVCFIFSYNIYIDFVLHTAISIFFTIYRHWFYIAMETFEYHNKKLVEYLLDNYSAQNYRFWKRCVLLSLCFYGIIACLLFTVNSGLIIIYILEYIIAFIVVDVAENKTLDKIIQNYKDKPTHIVHAKFTIDDTFYDSLQYPINIHNRGGTPSHTEENNDKNFGSISLLMIDNYRN